MTFVSAATSLSTTLHDICSPMKIYFPKNVINYNFAPVLCTVYSQLITSSVTASERRALRTNVHSAHAESAAKLSINCDRMHASHAFVQPANKV